jgi:hypothetical protein
MTLASVVENSASPPADQTVMSGPGTGLGRSDVIAAGTTITDRGAHDLVAPPSPPRKPGVDAVEHVSSVHLQHRGANRNHPEVAVRAYRPPVALLEAGTQPERIGGN